MTLGPKGNRDHLLWRVFGLAAFMAAMGVAATALDAYPLSTVELLAWLAVIGVSTAMAGLVAAVWGLLAHRRPQPTSRRMASVLAFGLLIGLVYGFSLAAGIALWEIPARQAPAEIIVTCAIVTPLYAIGITWIVQASDSFRSARDALVERLVRLEESRLQEEGLVMDLQRQVTDGMLEDLTRTRQLLDEQLSAMREDTAAARWPTMAAALREAAESSVRMTSHRLWQAAKADYPRTTVLRFMVAVARSQPFRPGLVMLLYVVGSGPTEVRDFGTPTGLFVTALVAGALWLVLSGANQAMRRLATWHGRIFVLVVGAIQAVAIMFAPLRSQIADTTVNAASLALGVVISVLVLFGTSSIGAWREGRTALHRALEADLDREHVVQTARNRALAEVTRTCARLLHGQVQTRLTACAAAIDLAADTGDASRAGEALERARHILTAPIDARATSVANSLWTELEAVTEPWNGLCDIVVLLDPTAEECTGSSDITSVARIVEEAVMNSVRHGGATDVEVHIRTGLIAGAACLEVRIDDNGIGPQAGPRGLGTALLDDSTQGRWGLAAGTHGGAHLTAWIPLALH